MLKTRKVKCPSCKECIDLDYYVDAGDMVKCTECYCEYELIQLFPPRLQRLYSIDEDGLDEIPDLEDDVEDDDDFDYFHKF